MKMKMKEKNDAKNFKSFLYRDTLNSPDPKVQKIVTFMTIMFFLNIVLKWEGWYSGSDIAS